MSDSWANSAANSAAYSAADSAADSAANLPSAAGLDLHLDRSGTRVRAGLEAALRDAVQTGRLAPRSRLPSSRALAADLGIARNTVADVYAQLVAEGWLQARQGSGTRVSDQVVEPTPSGQQPAAGSSSARYDLRPGVPDLSGFPRAEWVAATRRAVRDAPVAAFDYGDPRGRVELRTALANYLARVRGVRATPDQIVLCSGFTQGLRLLGSVLRASGASRLAIEGYGHQHHRDVVEATGLGLAPVEVDGNGARIEPDLDASAILLTPAHQFPTGHVLSPERRVQALNWAVSSGALVIEDDYDGEFRYDRRAIGSMQALDPARVVYAGTASKALAPAVGLAWLVVPFALLDDLIEAKRLSDGQGNVMAQLTLADLIRRGDYDRHIRRMRLAYRDRRARLLAALESALPGTSLTGIAAGMHAILRLPPGADEQAVVAEALRRGLLVDGMAGYCAPGIRYPDALMLGYATPPGHAFTTAVSRLAASIRAVR